MNIMAPNPGAPIEELIDFAVESLRNLTNMLIFFIETDNNDERLMECTMTLLSSHNLIEAAPKGPYALREAVAESKARIAKVAQEHGKIEIRKQIMISPSND